jgi:hypothetical protein
MKLLTQSVLSRSSHQIIKRYEDFSNNQIVERYEDFSKNETLTQKLKRVMKSVFICMFISSRRIFRLRQDANVMKI